MTPEQRFGGCHGLFHQNGNEETKIRNQFLTDESLMTKSRTMFAPTVTMDLKKSPLKIARFSKKPFVIFRVSTQASLFREVHIFRESSQLVGPKFRKKDQCMVYIFTYI